MNALLLKKNMILWGLSFLKLPLLLYIRPKITRYDESTCHIRVNLQRRTQNHLKSMYFGALAMGAELSIAGSAVLEIWDLKQPIDFIFKDFQCQFLKRANSDVIFVSHNNQQVKGLLLQALKTGERYEKTFTGEARSADHPELVFMAYRLTLSVKAAHKKS